MKLEVDQSGRIESTQTHTILAFSNGATKTIRLAVQNKRKLIKTLRTIGKPETFYLLIFSSCLFLLLKGTFEKDHTIILDQEYTGKFKEITKNLQTLCKEAKIPLKADIYEARITKRSRAHEIAIRTFRGELSPNINIPPEEVLKLIKKIKSSAASVHP